MMKARLHSHRFLLVLFFGLISSLSAQVPEWIWHNQNAADDEVRYFRKEFAVLGVVAKATLTIAADNQVTAYLNGKKVGGSDDWNAPSQVDLTKELKPGQNVLAARARNESGIAALLAQLDLTYADGKKATIISDTSWLSSDKEGAGWADPGFAAAGWAKPVSFGKLGVAPWGDVVAGTTASAQAGPAGQATPAASLTVLDGFKVELLHSASKQEGSWIAMAIDAQGRLIVSPQGDKQPLLRITLAPEGQVAKLEKIELPVWTAMDLLHAFDSLYVSGNGSRGLGLYRLRDTNGDDQYDQVDFLRKFDGGDGEHGSHGLVLGPDQMIYYIHGNFVKLPSDLSPASQHKNYAEDQLLPRQEDGNGFGVGNKPPGGFVVRMDRDGKTCELYASGMRNAYDFDFNAAGEMFTFDSDMEWDWGTPWYRPIRVCHLVSGGDYGFREGTGKFPTYYLDSLPPVVDIGVGSPTGVKFGTRSAFPAKYRKALFVMDWSYGRILAVHLTPSGASYRGTFENFVVGKPLNVTDLEFGKDGAMYFTTGGRGTQSGLYRVTFAGASTAPHAPSADERKAEREAVEARALRHKLEAFHGKQDPQAIDFAWPHLNSPDRWIRYAARLAIESQPVDQWQKRALDERDVNASLTALLALARLGPKESQDELLENLGQSWPDGMNEEQKIEALRVSSLAFIRLGKPSTETAQDVAKSLAPLYPSPSPRFNRELCQLLIYLDAPEVVQKTLGLLARAETEEEQLFYIFHLRQAKGGWSMDDRQTYFSWFNRDRARDKHSDETVKWFRDAGRDYADGASFPKFMSNIRKEAVALLTDEERAELAPLIAGQRVEAKAVVSRSFVKDWKLDDFSSSFDQLNQGRSFEKGREAFAVAQCLACHRFGNEGGSTGPDITGAASRFNHRDLLETILDPSKVVSDQYQNIVVTKKDGGDVTGRLVEEADDQIVLITNPLTGDRTAVSKRDIQKRAPSKISPMPEGLLTILSKEEILDLLAYIESGGKKDHGAFQRK